MTKIYVASPFGFADSTRDFYYERLIPSIQRAFKQRVIILDPWDLTDRREIYSVATMPYGPARKEAWENLNIRIAENNRTAIDACDGMFACLDGPDVDSGTASEIGYAFAIRKLIVGYRTDFRRCGDNDGAIVNLQVEYFIRKSGGDIFSDMYSAAHLLESKWDIV